MASPTNSAMTWNLEAMKPPLGVNPEFPWRNSATLIAGGGTGADRVTDKCTSTVMRFGPRPNEMGRYHIHHQCDNIYYLLLGEMTSIIGGVRFKTKAGEAIFMPRDVPHATGSFGEEEVYLWEIYNPSSVLADGTHDSYPYDLPDTITDSRTGHENGVRIWDLADLPEIDSRSAVPWRSSRILAGGGNPDAPDQVTDKTEVVLERFASHANAFGSYHVHHQSDSIWVVIKGRLRSIIGGKYHETAAGEVIFIPANVPHATGNYAEEDMVAFVVYTPSSYMAGKHDSEPVKLPSVIETA
jgi:mannose-6-phosphate isomerase-like protein (cupin superfamily)